MYPNFRWIFSNNHTSQTGLDPKLQNLLQRCSHGDDIAYPLTKIKQFGYGMAHDFIELMGQIVGF